MDFINYMEIAEVVSSRSPMTFNMGAVLVDRKGNVVSSGFNSYRTHPKYGTQKTPYRYMHAEGSCIYNAVKKGKKTEGCSIFVFRKNWRLARPCAHCMELIREAGIQNIYYTDQKQNGNPIIISEKHFNVV